MTLFPTNASADQFSATGKKVELLSATWTEYIEEVRASARAQGLAEGMEAAAKIVDAIESNSIWPPFIAASIREASKTKGP